jgi:hypothetical protein
LITLWKADARDVAKGVGQIASMAFEVHKFWVTIRMRRCDGSLTDAVHVVPRILVSAVEFIVPYFRPDPGAYSSNCRILVATMEIGIGVDAGGSIEYLVNRSIV